MNKEKFKEIMKKCFGKQKDDRWHAVAMLILYGFFFIFVFIFLNTLPDVKKEPEPTPSPTSTPKVVENYYYRYVVKYDDEQYVISGRKIDNSDTFMYVKGDIIKDYAVVDNELYLVNGNNKEKVEEIDSYYKYLNKDKIMGLIDYNKCDNVDNSYTCAISNKNISTAFGDIISSNLDVTNLVIIEKENDNVKNIKLDFDNYISNLRNETHRLQISMEYNKEDNK